MLEVSQLVNDGAQSFSPDSLNLGFLAILGTTSFFFFFLVPLLSMDLYSPVTLWFYVVTSHRLMWCHWDWAPLTLAFLTLSPTGAAFRWSEHLIIHDFGCLLGESLKEQNTVLLVKAHMWKDFIEKRTQLGKGQFLSLLDIN